MVDKKLLAGGMTLGAFIASMAAIIATTPPNTIFYCQSLDIVHYCEKLSSTNGTCYWKDNSSSFSKYCKATWKPITQFVNITVKNQSSLIVTDEQILKKSTCFICDEELMKEIKASIFPNDSIDDIDSHIKEKSVKRLEKGLVNVEYVFDVPLNEKGDYSLNIVGYEENLIIAPKL